MNLYRTFSQAPIRVKVIMVGDSGVGKTNIRERFCRNTFTVFSTTTIGVEYASRKFWAPWSGKKERFQICVWDVAGSQAQSMITPLYFKNALAVIYVYDVTKQQSLESLYRWRQVVLDSSNCPKMSELVIGNKTDLVNLREVSFDKAKKWANQNGIQLICESSALLNMGIEDAFQSLITILIREMQTRGIAEPMKLEKKEKRHRGCC